jgi:hypothetical protein
MKTFTQFQSENELKPGGLSTFIKSVNFPKSGDFIPTDAFIQIYFCEKKPDRVFFRYNTDSAKSLPLVVAYKYLKGFSKPPTMKTLEKYSNDAIAKTPTGFKTEPDGFGEDNSPSWLLVMGLI